MPDADTDMDMHAFYVACLEAGLTDLEIVSKIRLYGVRSDSTAATGVDVLQNYKMDADSAIHVNKDRADKLGGCLRMTRAAPPLVRTMATPATA